jgi:outer membrane protein TolC
MVLRPKNPLRGGWLVRNIGLLLLAASLEASAQTPAALPAIIPPVPTQSPTAPRAPTSLPDALPPLPPEPSSPETMLFPGQTLQPIDLTNALRLAGARNLDIATARQRVSQSLAELEQARALWLPTIFLGPTWYRADGKVQSITGQVINVDRSSLFLGGLAASPNSFPAASPGTGYPPLNGLSSVLRISDAIYEPMAARRVAAANRAGLQAASNDAVLATAEAYFDLQQASGDLAIAREAAMNAKSLSDVTGSFVRAGEGLEADHRRARTELKRQQKQIQDATGRLKVASANLVRVLVLNPRAVVAPAEPAEAVVRLVPDEIPLDDLIVCGLRCRPELAQAQEQVQATLVRLKQARMRPFIPSVSVSYAGGGFGGGSNAFFGNFGARGDAAASLFWELQNLGFTDRAIAHRRSAERHIADIDFQKVQVRVASEVVASYESRAAASRQMTEAREAVVEALESLQLNFTNIRGGARLPGATRPIEVLQPIQALAQVRADYLGAVLAYNRSQFRLYRALGNAAIPTMSTTPPPRPPG